MKKWEMLWIKQEDKYFFLFVVGEEKMLVLGLKILEIVGELLEISKTIGNLW